MDSEFEYFKRNINVSEYLASYGFVVNKNDTTPGSVCMQREDTKIIIARNLTSGHWIYFEKGFAGKNNKGTILDLAKNINGINNLGEIRKNLRPWASWKNRPKIDPSLFVRTSHIIQLGRSEFEILKRFHSLWEVTESEAIEKFLVPASISNKIWQHERFKGCLFSDEFNNLVFPHYLGKKVVGLELYNLKFKGFYPGSKKCTWFTKRLSDDNTLVLTNLAVNSLFIFRENSSLLDYSWCLSTGGEFGEDALKMVRFALEKYRGQKVLLAFDSSDEGSRAQFSVNRLLDELKMQSSVEILSPTDGFWVRS